MVVYASHPSYSGERLRQEDYKTDENQQDPVWGWEQLNQTGKHKQRKSQTFKYCETFINYKMPYETFGKLNNNEENLNHEHLSKIVYAFF